MNSAFVPRAWSALVALLCVGALMWLAIANETPTGAVRGRVVLAENNAPLAHAKITLTSGGATNSDISASGATAGDKVRRLRATTDGEGNFELPRVEVGQYQVAATSRAHASEDVAVWVSESEIAPVALRLKRTEPDLKVAQQQTDWTPRETAILPVQGYTDATDKGGAPLRVRIFRTHFAQVLRDEKAAESLGKVANRYEPVAYLPANLMHPKIGAAPVAVEHRVLAVKGADIEGFFHQRIALGKLAPGLYLVEVAHGANRVCAQLSVSDTALVVKKAAGKMVAYAADSASGAPRAGAAIRLFRGGKTVAQASTDSQGLARLTIPSGDDGGGRLMTLASLGDSEASVGQYDYSEGDEERGKWTVHAYTDRPLYRPGGVVSWKGIARTTLERGLKYGVVAGAPVEVEVRDPDGTRLQKSALALNSYGSFHGSIALSPEAPTGSYSLVMTLGGEEHTADFEVASYRKPEFSATVTPNQTHYATGETVEMMVAASYYFGAPVAGAKAHYDVYRAPDWATLYGSDEDEDYQDEGDYDAGAGESVQSGDIALDANGHAIIKFAAQKPLEKSDDEAGWDATQDQLYTVSLTVTDAAHRTVDAQGEVPVSAGSFRLSLDTQGAFAAPDQASVAMVRATDFAGHPVVGQAVELLASYRFDDDKRVENSRRFRAVTDASGAAKISFVPSRQGVLTLDASATDADNRAIETTRSLWVADDGGGDYDANYTDLSVLTERKSYRAGESARVLVNAARARGTALLTLEGAQIYRAWIVPLPRKSNVISVPMLENYGPNVTLSACLVQNKKFARSEVPLRVEVPHREVRVAVHSDRAKYQPGERATYQIETTDAGGKPLAAEVSFGVVDEAIYALQEDDKTALRRAFYPRNPNDVATSYSFEPLYLGDVNKAEPNITARSKFLDTAFWQPDVMTDQNGRAQVSFALPDNLTTWRATAIAQTRNAAFGRQSAPIVVAKDFFVRLDTPRFFTGGDAGQITALVHNETGAPQNATVKMEADGLTLEGAATQTLSLNAGQVGQIVWPIQTDSNGLGVAGRARLKLSAWTPGAHSYTDAVETSLLVRPRGRERIRNVVGQIGRGGVSQNLNLDAAAIPANSRVTLRLTPSVSDALVGALPYLTGFPYGCTEQTMSRFLPDILVQRALRLSGKSDAQSVELRRKLPVMARDGLTRLRRFQHQSGGWGWWENDADDAWMTAYVVYGLAQARAEGYDVPTEMLDNGRAAALKLLAQGEPKVSWQRHNWENTRAFALYAVALADPSDKERAQVRSLRLQTATQTLDAQALGYLVLLDKKLALKSGSWDGLQNLMRREGNQMWHWSGGGHQWWADWDDVTATALGLQAMIAHDATDPDIAGVVLWLMTHRRDDAWGNTRDTAWSLGALCDYLGAQPRSNVGSPAPQVTVALNKRVIKTWDLAGADGEIQLEIPWSKLRASGNNLSLTRSDNGEGAPVFYAMQVRQTIGSEAPLAAQSSAPPGASPIRVTREFRRVTTSNGTIGSEPTQGQLRQGDAVRVRLTFRVPDEVSYVLIEDALPAGCEVTERGDAGVDEWDSWWSSTDVRDDRIAFFARHLTRGQHVIEYNLRAQTPGTYRVLPTLLQAMYDGETRAESSEDRVEIR